VLTVIFRFDVAMCALAKSNPAWLSSKIAFADGADLSNLAQATFTVYDADLSPHSLAVKYTDMISDTSDDSDVTKAW
jgi:hypothetical protein